jgi:hypothetical protein
MSIAPSYFKRSQKRTYAIDAAKNTIVTAIHRTSCISNLLNQSHDGAWLTSERNPFVRSQRDSSQWSLELHGNEFSAPPRSELRKVNPDWPGRHASSLLHESRQHAQQKRHCGNTQYCKCNVHNATAAPVAETIPNMILPFRS